MERRGTSVGGGEEERAREGERELCARGWDGAAEGEGGKVTEEKTEGRVGQRRRVVRARGSEGGRETEREREREKERWRGRTREREREKGERVRGREGRRRVNRRASERLAEKEAHTDDCLRMEGEGEV